MTGRDGHKRVLVATDHQRCPTTALKLARAAAGEDGEVVLLSVLVVPVTQPLDANLGRSVSAACDVLERGEEQMRGTFDTRLVRARSFAKGVLQTLTGEPFDLVVLERDREQRRDAGGAQVETLLEKAEPTVVVVRP